MGYIEVLCMVEHSPAIYSLLFTFLSQAFLRYPGDTAFIHDWMGTVLPLMKGLVLCRAKFTLS